MTHPSELHSEALLGFDGTVYRLDGGYEISFEIRRAEASKEVPHGYRYSFVLRGPGADGQVGNRIFGYDNAHAPIDGKWPHDHLHKTKRGPGGAPVGVRDGVGVKVRSIDELIGMFMDQCLEKLNELGVNLGSLKEEDKPSKAAGSKTRGRRLGSRGVDK